jgi:hypothetical protein
MPDKYAVADSGTRRDFTTGAHRDMAEGKGRFDLLPYWSLMELAKHYEAGAKKYDDNNWRKGIPLKVFFDSAMRHLAKLAMGYTDERHDLAALWNIACYIETARRIDLGLLPVTLRDFPHVRMPYYPAMEAPVKTTPPPEPGTEVSPTPPWTPPTREQQRAYIEDLKKLNFAPNACAEALDILEDEWSLEECRKPLDIEGNTVADPRPPAGWPYKQGGPSLGPCGQGSCGAHAIRELEKEQHDEVVRETAAAMEEERNKYFLGPE